MIVQCFKLQRVGISLPIDTRLDPGKGLDGYMNTLLAEGRLLIVCTYVATRSKLLLPDNTPYTDAVRFYRMKNKNGKLSVETFYPQDTATRVVSWPPKS